MIDGCQGISNMNTQNNKHCGYCKYDNHCKCWPNCDGSKQILATHAIIGIGVTNLANFAQSSTSLRPNYANACNDGQNSNEYCKSGKLL